MISWLETSLLYVIPRSAIALLYTGNRGRAKRLIPPMWWGQRLYAAIREREPDRRRYLDVSEQPRLLPAVWNLCQFRQFQWYRWGWTGIVFCAIPGTCTAGPGGNTPGVGYWATDRNTLSTSAIPQTPGQAAYTPHMYSQSVGRPKNPAPPTKPSTYPDIGEPDDQPRPDQVHDSSSGFTIWAFIFILGFTLFFWDVYWLNG